QKNLCNPHHCSLLIQVAGLSLFCCEKLNSLPQICYLGIARHKISGLILAFLNNLSSTCTPICVPLLGAHRPSSPDGIVLAHQQHRNGGQKGHFPHPFPEHEPCPCQVLHASYNFLHCSPVFHI